MNLLCIDSPNTNKLPNGKTVPYDGPDPEIGSEYTAYDEYKAKDGIYYFLVGFPANMAYHNSLFAVLPDASADEMHEETKEAIVNLETA